MNYSNLEKEIQEYTDYNKQAIVTISKLSQFYKSFGQQGKKFIKSSQSYFEDFSTELSKENTSSTIFITYNYYSMNIRKLFKTLEEIFDNFELRLGDYMEKYETKFKNSYGEVINQFNALSNTINEKKEKLEKSKYTYFDCCKNTLDVENKIIQQKDNKLILREDVSRLNEQLGKAMKIVDTNEQLYKTEIDKMNKLYIDSESKYKEIIQKLRNINMEKIKFFSEVLKIFYNISHEGIEKQTEIINTYTDEELIKNLKRFHIIREQYKNKDLYEKQRLKEDIKEDLYNFISSSKSSMEADNIISNKNSVPHTLNIAIDDVKSLEFAKKLEDYDVFISTKTSCCPSQTPSKLVYALTNDKKLALSSLRISFSHLTKKEDINKFLEAFDKCYKEF